SASGHGLLRPPSVAQALLRSGRPSLRAAWADQFPNDFGMERRPLLHGRRVLHGHGLLRPPWPEGAQRAKVLKYTGRSEYHEAEAVALGDTMGERVEAEALARSATTEFESYVKLNKKVTPEAVGVVQQIEDYAKRAVTIASHIDAKDTVK